MTDPLSTVSAISAVVGLADVVLGTSLKLYKFFYEVRDASKEIQVLVYSLRVCTQIAQEVRTFTTNLQSSSIATGDSLELRGLGGLEGALKAFEEALKPMGWMIQDHKASDPSKFRQYAKNLKWVLGTQRIRSAQQRLDRANQSLATALSLVNNQGNVSLRTQFHNSITENTQRHEQLLQKFGNLDHTLVSRHDRQDQSLLQISAGLRHTRQDLMDAQTATQCALSRDLRSVGASFTTGHAFIDEKLGTLHAEIRKNHANTTDQVYCGNQEMKLSLASIEQKLVLLTITQEKGKDLYSLFADQSPRDLLLPLMQMDSHLIPFLLELTGSGKVMVNQQDMDNILDQFEDLLASCYEASAAFTRSKRKNKYRKPIQDNSTAVKSKSNVALHSLNAICQLRQQKREDHNSRRNRRRLSRSQRRGIWIKRLPHGLLRIQLAPITENDNRRGSHGLHACFTFQPHFSLDTKCISTCFESGVQAMGSPKAFHNFRTYGWFDSKSLTMQILRTDDFARLQDALSKGLITPWDQHIILEPSNARSILGDAVYIGAPKCVRVLVEQGADMQCAIGDKYSASIGVYGARNDEHDVVESLERLRQIQNILVQHGADLVDDWCDFNEEFSGTPLQGIARIYSETSSSLLEEEIRYLLSKGYDINACDTDGMTPLLDTVESVGFTHEAVTTWIAAGANPTSFDNQGRNALHILASTINCVTFTYPRNFETIFEKAAKTAIYLVNSGCDLFAVDNLGRTPAMYMRHTWLEKVWTTWRDILHNLELIDAASLEDVNRDVCCPHPGSFSACDCECHPITDRLMLHYKNCRKCSREYCAFDNYCAWIKYANPSLFELSDDSVYGEDGLFQLNSDSHADQNSDDSDADGCATGVCC